MPPSEPRFGRYLLALAAVAAAATGSVAMLNAAMDPYGLARERWYRLRPAAFAPLTDETPDGGLTDRIHAVARSTAPILLLGTSRTMAGFATDEAHMFNAGKQAASLHEIERIMAAAASRPVPPRVYLLEAPPLRPDDPAAERFGGADRPPAVDLYLSPLTTRMSARLALNAWRGIGTTGRSDFQRPAGGGGIPAGADRAMRGDAAAQGAVGRSAAFQASFARLAALCARSRATLVVHEAPLSPRAPADLADAARERAALVGAAVRRASEGSACRLVYLDVSEARTLGGSAGDPAHWWDHLHFDPVVGAAILERAQRRLARP
ncbi:MAG TPA: hypothetical protein VF552_11440 [Allosphingosinicella sp.]|jgi:hypothetical protein